MFGNNYYVNFVVFNAQLKFVFNLSFILEIINYIAIIKSKVVLVTVDVPLFNLVKSINMNLKVNVYVFVFTKSFNCFLFLPIALNRKTSQLNSLIILATFPAQPK